MPTDNTIGTGGDYTSINLWIDDLPVDLAGQGRQRGRLFAQEFDEPVIITGNANPSVDDYIELTADDGASFADNDTNRLAYVPAQGAAIEWSSGNWTWGINLGVQYTRFNRIQVNRNGTQQYGMTAAANTTISRCVIRARNRPVTPANIDNCLVIAKSNVDNILCRSDSETKIQYCTGVADPFDNRTRNVIRGSYSTPQVKNVAGFGQGDLYDISNVSGDSTTNASDTSQNLTGSDLTNLTYNKTTPFIDGQDGPTTDYKIFAGSPLEGAGQPSSNIDFDIFGNPRHPTNPSIGCHESQVITPGTPETNALLFGHNF